MLKEWTEKLLSLAEIKTRDIDGRFYSDRKMELIVPPGPEALTFGTLEGFVDFINHGPDKLDRETLLVHVQGPQTVSLHGNLDENYVTRDEFARAVATIGNDRPFAFGTYFEQEDFVVLLQSQFQPTPDQAKLLKVVGRMTGESVTTRSDDGVTQTVSTKAGIHLEARAEIENPVRLKPYRTFRELAQPESPFIFRVKQDRDGQVPRCALFEADGGAWKLEAMNSIAMELRLSLSKLEPVVRVVK